MNAPTVLRMNIRLNESFTRFRLRRRRFFISLIEN